MKPPDVIRNNGLSEARNIKVFLEDKPIEESGINYDKVPEVVNGEDEESCIIFSPNEEMPQPPFDTEVKWDDDSSKNRIKRTKLTWPA